MFQIKTKELISRGAILLLKEKNIKVRERGELKHEQLFCLNVVLMSPYWQFCFREIHYVLWSIFNFSFYFDIKARSIIIMCQLVTKQY